MWRGPLGPRVVPLRGVAIPSLLHLTSGVGKEPPLPACAPLLCSSEQGLALPAKEAVVDPVRELVVPIVIAIPRRGTRIAQRHGPDDTTGRVLYLKPPLARTLGRR